MGDDDVDSRDNKSIKPKKRINEKHKAAQNTVVDHCEWINYANYEF